MANLIDKKEFMTKAELPRQTFERWLREGKIKPVTIDEKGKAWFSLEQIDAAKALHHPENNPNKKSASTDASASLFTDNDTIDKKSIDADIADKADGNDDGEWRDTYPPPTVLSDCRNTDEEHMEKEQTPSLSADNQVDAGIISDTEGDKGLDLNVDDIKHADGQECTDYININSKNFSSLSVMATEEHVTLDERAARIRKLITDVQQSIIKIGFELISAKKEVGHGGWSAWLQTNFQWTDRTARNFMAVAERFGNRKNFSDLNSSTLISMLKLPTGDEEAFIDAQADAGRPIKNQSARELKRNVAEWKQAKTVSAKDADVDTQPAKIASVVTLPTLQPDSQIIPSADENPSKRLPPLANHTGNYEWYTPSQYIDAARNVLGDIDLDPASCALANQTVKAKEFFTTDVDGLTLEWRGRVWLNPPFATGLIERFVDKLVEGVDNGDISSAICLVHNCTETEWFRRLIDKSSAVVFTNHRINFVASDGTLKAGTSQRGQAFIYFGSDPNKFFDTFQQFGYGMKKYSPSDTDERKGTNNE